VDNGIIIGPDDSTSLEVLWETTNPSGTITVVETVDGVGCSGSDKHYIVINSVPRPSITGPNNTCNKSMQDYSTYLTQGHSYLWRIDGGNIVGDNEQTYIQVNWNTSGTFGIVYLIETNDSTGCTDSTSLKVALYSAPVVTIEGSFIVKKGSTQSYSGPSSGVSGYKWQVTGGVIYGANNLKDATVIWGTQKTGSIKLTCTNSNGCTDSLLKNVIIGNSSVIITGSESVCEQNTVYYLTPFISGRTNEWSAIGGVIEGSTSDTILQVIWGDAGNGSITLIQTVDATQHKDTGSIDIVIHPLPQVSINGKDTIIRGRTYTYIASPTDGTYQWYATNGTISGSTTDYFVDITWDSDDKGSVKLIETTKAGCIDSAILDIKLIISSVRDHSNLNNTILKLIPNPVEGKAKIEITGNESIYANLQIINSYGRVINNFGNIFIKEGTQFIDWDCRGVNGESIPSGIYFVKLSGKFGTEVVKAIVLK
jgi:hypothetical protein